MPKSRRVLKAEDCYRLKEISDPQISRDGDQVACIISWGDQRRDRRFSDVWLISRDGRRRFQLTNRQHRDAAPRWSPDGTQIAFLAPGYADETAAAQIWIIPVTGGEARQLTRLARGASSPAWSPDGKRIAFLTAEPPPAASRTGSRDAKVTTREGRVYAGDVTVVEQLRHRSAAYPPRADHRHIHVVRLSDGRVRRITGGDGDDADPCWSPDGRMIAFTSTRGRDTDWDITTDVWVAPADGGAPRRFSTLAGGASGPVWSPDGALLAYVGVLEPKVPQDAYRIWVQSTDGGQATSLTESLDEVPHSPRWSPDGSTLYFQYIDEGLHSIWRVDLDGNMGPVLPRNRCVSAYTVSQRDGAIVFLHATPKHPGDLFACDRDGRRERRLTNENRGFLHAIRLGSTDSFWCTSFDGTRIQAWLVKPPAYRPNRKYPLVLMVHGGPAAAYLSDWNFDAHVLAARGYVVLYCNPRGSRGYGTTFMNSVTSKWGQDDSRDVLAVLDCALARASVDPGRLGVKGASYGGFMATWLLGTTDRFRAGVAECAAADRGMWYYSGDVHLWCEEDQGGPPWEQQDGYDRVSSTSHAHEIDAPLLLLHAEDDSRVPISTSDILYTTVKRRGVDTVLVRYPSGEHGFSHSSFRYLCDTLNRTIDWFDRHLRAP